MESIWNIASYPFNYPKLTADTEADVVIIGGGITGISIAHLLQKEGLEILVLEGRKIGLGTTGHSTGNLYCLTEYPLQLLKRKYDLKTIHNIITSRRRALDFIEDNIARMNIECDFEHRSMYIFDTYETTNLDKEYEVAEELGLNVIPISSPDFPFSIRQGLEFKDQAQFNPLKYVQQLAARTHEKGCEIYEHSRVVKIEEEEDYIHLQTETNTIKAKYVVHATHTPIDLQLEYHPFLGPYREYGVAAKLEEGSVYPYGIYWGNFPDGKFSVRTYAPDGDPFLICIGSMHKGGQAKDYEAHLNQVEEFMKHHFNVRTITHRWAGQNYKSADLLPYIGAKKPKSNQYFATGFSTDGLIYGSMAALILSDEILGRKNQYSELYRSDRNQPAKSVKNFAKENLNVAVEWIADFLKKGSPEEAEHLLPGQGKILQIDKEKVAVFKNSDGILQYLSPICPHMRCHVHWNNAEKTWDCPCHGSRFDTNGEVIEGPALDGLMPIYPEEK